MNKKLLLILLFFSVTKSAYSQNCNCETEFSYIKAFMEKNYSGFKDKQALMTPAGYKKLADEYSAYSKGPHSSEKCLLIISQFLDHFKDQHVSVGVNFDPYKADSAFIQQRQIMPISDARIAELRNSKTYEGIYDFHEPAKYKIAVIKDKTALHDYVGIIISSNLPGWKRGMIKFEGKLISDSLAKGVLYILNQMPKQEYFDFGKDYIGGDWQREGTNRVDIDYTYEPVASKQLSEKTLYIKVSNFDPSNAKNIDSILRVNEKNLKTTPNLVLDLRGNGGGADFAYMPLLPYLYTGPVKEYGVSLLSTDANVEGWKKYLENKDQSEENLKSIRQAIQQMENNRGKWIRHSDDDVISNYTKLPYPKKVVILIDHDCASSTEQFLLFARQSSKVTLMGQNTSGTLDYSNVVEAPFSCMPYTLRYSTSRSRRLDHNQGIDNLGIKPQQYLSLKDDWITKARAELEK
jgi:hypothetical protein